MRLLTGLARRLGFRRASALVSSIPTSLLIGLAAALPSAARSPVPATAPAAAQPAGPRYTYSRLHDPNGIGKFYMGREIAQVMGHEGMRWLDRRQRDLEESPDKMIDALNLKKGDVVADIGAGSGYITTRLARAVGREGRVKAVDIQQEMLDALKRKLGRARIHNVDLVLGETADPRLEPESIDLALMVDVYHEFEFPYEMMRAIVPALKLNGRVVLVEYRMEDPSVPIKLVHKMTADQAVAEMKAVGLELDEKIDVLPRQHILIFRQPPPASAPASDASTPEAAAKVSVSTPE